MKPRLAVLMLTALVVFACNRVASLGSLLPAAGQTAFETPAPLATPTDPSTPTPSPTITVTHTPFPPVPATRTSTPTFTATATATITPSPTGTYVRAGAVSVPILMYHRVTSGGAYRYAVSAASFRKQMEILAAEGYQTITISELAAAVRGGGYLSAKTVAITFDDGFMDVYENALPIMEAHGFKATVYIITGVLETKLAYGYMQTKELAELAAAGWEIGSHTVSHTDLRAAGTGLSKELDQAREDLETRLGIQVQTFAYPFAAASDEVKDFVEERGYTAAVGVGVVNRHTPKSLYFLSRREVYNTTSLAAFKQLLVIPPEPTKTPLPTRTNWP